MALVSIYANIIIIPIMMYHFNTVSFTFIISNLSTKQVHTGYKKCLQDISNPIQAILKILLELVLNHY